MIYQEKPEMFSPRFEIASCYLEHDGKFVLLHRNENKSQGGKWGVVAGKLDAGETMVEAMIRECKEETGVDLAENQLQYFKSLPVHHGDYDFVYHMFVAKLNEQPEIRIEPKEHQNFAWVLPSEALQMSLVDDLGDCIRMYYEL